MIYNKSRNFWEKKHKNNDRYWLTDSDPDYVYDLHNLSTSLIRSKYNILEVGVGTGRSIIRLSELHDVYAVDIAKEALKKVKLFATTFLFDDESSWPKDLIDIALCHLVLQHCDETDLIILIKLVLESLTPKGYFSFQTADVKEENLNRIYKDFVKRGLMFFRSKDEIRDIVEDLGGRVISVSDDLLHYEECDIIWNFFRVCRRK